MGEREEKKEAQDGKGSDENDCRERRKRCLTACVFCAWPNGPQADRMMGT